jgi:hypothetical protein
MNFKMMERVVADQTLSNPTEKLVMLVLTFHDNSEHGCFPSVDIFGAAFHLSGGITSYLPSKYRQEPDKDGWDHLGFAGSAHVYEDKNGETRLQKAA